MTNPDNPHFGLYRRRLGVVFAVVSPVVYLLDFTLWELSHQWWGTIFLVLGLFMIWYYGDRKKLEAHMEAHSVSSLFARAYISKSIST